MGNICCQADVIDSPLEQIMPHFKDYTKVEWTQNDQILHDLKTKYQHQEQNNQEPPSLLKHKQEDRYYIGSWDKQGHPTGQGIIYEPDRLFFQGNFQKGIPSGESKIRFLAKNCQYEGNLKEGKAYGPGKFYDFNTRYQFDGQWEDSKPKEGKLTLNNDKNVSNIVYTDFKTGYGVINYKDLRQYKGYINTKKIVPDGKGIVYFPYTSSKLQYQGQWHMGQMHGKGKMQWKDGSIYEGEYVHGKKQGFGKFIFSSKTSYEGAWYNGKQEGAGILFDFHGEQQKRGLWQNGKLIEQLTPEKFGEQRKKDEERIKHSKQDDENEHKNQEKHQKSDDHKSQDYHTGRPHTIKQEQHEESNNNISGSRNQEIKQQLHNISGSKKSYGEAGESGISKDKQYY